MDEATLKTLGILILLLPAAGTVVAGTFGSRRLKGATHWPVILGVGGAVVASLALFRQVAGAGPEAGSAYVSVYEWLSAVRGAWFHVEFLIDPLSAVMLVTVTFISLLVIVYSRDYMRHHDHPERGYERFFAFLGLFVFSMCALVLGGNFVLLYLGWEAVGLCSYLLIGFYYQRPSAAAAAKKAFLVNRIGDFGFGLGILLIFLTFGFLDYERVFEAARLATEGNVEGFGELFGLAPVAAEAKMAVVMDRLPIIALLLFCGAVGKSAQIPLYVWLPDAMEGPSPVSALIHAATMVTAGVYMVVRCGAIFTASEGVMLLIAVVGGVTALFAATIALAQYDMKRILAYSTISQLGYMFLGVGVFAASSAIFHLFTHAFFKALLFLAAGSVMHAMGGIIDVRRFGGLKRILPVTFWTTLIGAGALAGFPFLAGFWSKDEIIHHAMMQHPVLGVLGLVTAVLTAFYTFRMVFLAFWGEQRVPEGVTAHESGGWMLCSLVILAVGACTAGFVGVHIQSGGFAGFLEPEGYVHRFLEPVARPFTEGGHATAEAAAYGAAAAAGEHAAEHSTEAAGSFWGAIVHHWLMYVSALLAIVGIAAAYVCYVRRPWIPQLLKSTSPEAYLVLHNKYYVDEAYDTAFVRPLRKTGVTCHRVDDYGIDGVLWLITAVPRFIGFVFRTLQSGAIQGYGLSMVTGLAIILMWCLLA
jgi:NADH-quinone oxidoreductase subunit L